MKKITIIVLVAFLVLNVFNVFSSVNICSASGNILYVNASGGGDNYTKIQDAIDAAEPDDEIYVYSGEYHENIVINKNIVLTGENKDNTIIDGDHNDRVINAHGSELNDIVIQISGFSIRNAGGTGKDCIALDYVNSSTINNNKIMNSYDSDGIQLSHCNSVTISENAITGNKQCGVYLISSTSNTIRNNNQIQNNGIGICLYLSSDNSLYKNDFSDNVQNANDSGTNSWSYGNQGNYWDDYTGKDQNHDKIGDKPYNIPGGNNQDLFPLGYFTEEPPENQKPVAYLSVNPNPAYIGQTVNFNGDGQDDGTIVAYELRIDGSVVSYNKSYSSSSLLQGTHSVSFRVMDDGEKWSDYVYATLVIYPNQKPVAYILKPIETTIQFGEAIEFLGYGEEPGGHITGYLWSSYPSGISSVEALFSISNLPVGPYIIYFKVRDENEVWSEIVSKNITIIPTTTTQDSPPVVHAGGPYSGLVNNSITFDGSNSYDPDTEDVLTYQWIFGDGSTGYGVSTEHTYDSKGNYTLELTITDEHGVHAQDVTYVNVALEGNNQNSSQGKDNVVPGFEIAFVMISILLLVFYNRYKKKR